MSLRIFTALFIHTEVSYCRYLLFFISISNQKLNEFSPRTVLNSDHSFFNFETHFALCKATLRVFQICVCLVGTKYFLWLCTIQRSPWKLYFLEFANNWYNLIFYGLLILMVYNLCILHQSTDIRSSKLN